MEPAGDIRLGYAAITWGGKDDQAIADISAVGFKAIQLRSSTFAAYVTRPAVLKDLLAKHGLTFAVLSSGNLKYQPGDRQASSTCTSRTPNSYVMPAGRSFRSSTRSPRAARSHRTITRRSPRR